jgi:hypothetical protein
MSKIHDDVLAAAAEDAFRTPSVAPVRDVIEVERTDVHPTRSLPTWRSSPRPWLLLSMAAAVVAMVGNVAGLARIEVVYGWEHPSLTDQAIAQDLVNLAVVSPLLIGFAVAAARGSARACLGWLGAVMFTVYNYVIYAMSIHFGLLFLAWVAVLGLASYALLGGLSAVDTSGVRDATHAEPARTAGWFLIVTAGLFAALWLSDIVPALASGGQPAAIADLGVPTNPVHVLDLAIFLPAAVAAGVLLLRRRPAGSVLGPALLMFLGLTGLPILVTVFVAEARDHPAGWAVVGPVGAITAAAAVLFALTTRPRAGRTVGRA